MNVSIILACLPKDDPGGPLQRKQQLLHTPLKTTAIATTAKTATDERLTDRSAEAREKSNTGKNPKASNINKTRVYMYIYV